MATTIFLFFDHLDDARSAVSELEVMGVARTDMGIVARDADTAEAAPRDMTGQDIRRPPDAVEGDTGDGGTGLGSLVASLTRAGLSQEDARAYAERVHRGGALVNIRDDQSDRAEAVLQAHNRADAERLGAAHRVGSTYPGAYASSGRDHEPRDGDESISDDPAPLSHALHAPTLSDDPAPLSHLLHIPVLTKD